MVRTRIMSGCFVLISLAVLRAATVELEVTPLGGSEYQYDYFVNGVTFQANEALDVQFDASLYPYGSLSSDIAPSGFSAFVEQPNNPPGLAGDYFAVASTNGLTPSGPFRVIVSSGGAASPGNQQFSLNQYDSEGNFIGLIDSGLVVQESSTGFTEANVPEPATLGLVCVAAVLATAGSIIRFRKA